MTERDNQDNGATVFDRALVAARRRRARTTLHEFDFLHAHVAGELSDRLLAVKRKFDVAAEIGARSGRFAASEAAKHIGHLSGCDLVHPARPTRHADFFIADEERLPFAAESLDLLVAPLCLHAVNDLPGVLVQFRRALKPDGLFLGTLFGGQTLAELRTAFMEAEIEIAGGASPHVSPFVDIRDGGALLHRAGLALPVADTDTLTVRYDSALHLMADLRGMGETNALLSRHRRPTARATLLRTVQIYHERFADPDGRVRASFEIVYLSGWAPHESQQQPLRPGSAKRRLADALGVVETSAGENEET